MDLAHATRLYRTYADDLRAVIDQQRAFLAAGRVKPQLDDVEAELTYLALRDHRPDTVMELGTFHGWSTTWILSALRDNGGGHLHSFDRVDTVLRTVPAELAADRWTFVAGDVAANLAAVPPDVGYLFVDADHGRRFARWYLAHLFPLVAAGTPVSVHDVFHGALGRARGRRARRCCAGSPSTRRRGSPPPAATRPATLAALDDVRAELGLTGARGTTVNPMIFFSLPSSAADRTSGTAPRRRGTR